MFLLIPLKTDGADAESVDSVDKATRKLYQIWGSQAFRMIRRADFEGSKSHVVMNAWRPQIDVVSVLIVVPLIFFIVRQFDESMKVENLRCDEANM